MVKMKNQSRSGLARVEQARSTPMGRYVPEKGNTCTWWGAEVSRAGQGRSAAYLALVNISHGSIVRAVALPIGFAWRLGKCCTLSRKLTWSEEEERPGGQPRRGREKSGVGDEVGEGVKCEDQDRREVYGWLPLTLDASTHPDSQPRGGRLYLLTQYAVCLSSRTALHGTALRRPAAGEEASFWWGVR